MLQEETHMWSFSSPIQQAHKIVDDLGYYVMSLMQKLITKKVQQNRDLVLVFNRYISAKIGLRQGHRQSEVQN
jgi:hypothetical protein